MTNGHKSRPLLNPSNSEEERDEGELYSMYFCFTTSYCSYHHRHRSILRQRFRDYLPRSVISPSSSSSSRNATFRLSANEVTGSCRQKAEATISSHRWNYCRYRAISGICRSYNAEGLRLCQHSCRYAGKSKRLLEFVIHGSCISRSRPVVSGAREQEDRRLRTKGLMPARNSSLRLSWQAISFGFWKFIFIYY